MNAIGVTVTLVAVAANTGIAVADFAGARFVLANSSEVGVPRRWLATLGAVKMAGAAGLVVGLLGRRPIGAVAAVGLTVFFVGAVAAHLRARVIHNLAFPLAYLALAVGALVAAA